MSAAGATSTSSCVSLLPELFDGVVDPDKVVAACSEAIEWDDVSAKAPAVDRSAVRELLAEKFPPGSKLKIDRIADGVSSSGFTWTREAITADGSPSQRGLRGTLFAELDEQGQLKYVREGCEPILKPGAATEALLKAATKNMERPPKPPPTFTAATPTTASGIVKYLWQEAYPNGAEPTEALRLFSDAITYEVAAGLELTQPHAPPHIVCLSPA